MRTLMNTFFNEFDSLSPVHSTTRFTSHHDDKNLYVEGLLPGYTKGDISVELEDEFLKIEAKAETDSHLVANEVSKCFKLPANKLDMKKADANYTNGILKVSIPYKSNVTKKIKIN
tara:strand:- start:200 stop:547 length:348 start_codon:yes stop_codon:yes gene_type:complete